MATREELLFILQMQDQATSVMAGFSRTITTTGSEAQRTQGNLNELSRAIGAVGVAVGALAADNALLKGTIGVFREYELGIANIQKVSGIGGDAVKDFEDRFDQLAKTIPVPIKQLQEMAYTAGSLGVQGTQNILAITEAMAKLGTTTNVTGEKGTLAVTQLLNIMHEAPTEAGRLASQLVSLDNVTAASASTILGLAREVGLSTEAFNVGSGRALALGAAVAALGVRAERGGTAVGRVFTALDQATRGDLPKGLTDLERLFGENAKQLRAMEEADPTAFFVNFMGKLHDVIAVGGNYPLMLKDFGLGQRETNNSIVPLAGHVDELRENLSRVAIEGKYATAQNREFAIFMETLDSKIKVASNSLQIFQKDLGGAVGGQAKGAVDGFNASIQFLDEQFKALSPQQKAFIVDEGLMIGSLVSLGVAVRAVITVFEALGAAALLNPWTAAVVAIGTVAAGLLALNTSTRESVELTQDETTKLSMLASGGSDAAFAIRNLTSAQAANIQLALDQKIEDEKNKMASLTNEIRTGQGALEFFTKALLGMGSTGTAQLEMLYKDFNDGKISEDAYKASLQQIIAENPGLSQQVHNVLALLTQWDNASAAVAHYKQISAQVDGVAKQFGPPVPDGFKAPTQAPAVATNFAGGDPKQKKGSDSHTTEVEDFMRETQEKIAGYQRETAALDVSTAAYERQQKVERENAEMEQVLKRATDLKIKDIQGLTKAYDDALKARDNAHEQAEAKDVVDSVEKKIAAFQAEDAALKKGAAAYAEYKRASKIDPEIDAFSKRLQALGMEADAVKKLADQYRAAANAHEQTEEQVAKDNALNKEAQDLIKGVGNELMKEGEAVLMHGKNWKAAAKEFENAVTEMIIKAAVLKPLEKEIDSLFSGGNGGGGGGGGSGGGGGGSSGHGGGSSGGSVGGSGGGGGGGGGGGSSSIFGAVAGQLGNIGKAAFKDIFGSASGNGGNNGNSGGSGGTQSGGMFDDDAPLGQAWNTVSNFAGNVGDDIGSAFSGFGDFIGSIFHEGGVVGERTLTRSMSAAIWNNAPRYHTGLGNDEFAAVLQRGERVLTNKQNGQMMDTMHALTNATAQAASQAKQTPTGNNVVFQIATPDANSFRSSQTQIYSKANVALQRSAMRGNA